MIRELVPCTDPILKTKLDRFDFSNPPMDPLELYRDLGETMVEHGGLGLAANQVGLPYRAFVLWSADIIGVFNPRIVDVSEETVVLEEACLSYPKFFVKIKRPAKIRARYTLPNGETVTRVFEGITARAFQHELDHLDGVIYTSRANSFHYRQAKRHAAKFAKVPVMNKSKLSPQVIDMMESIK